MKTIETERIDTGGDRIEAVVSFLAHEPIINNLPLVLLDEHVQRSDTVKVWVARHDDTMIGAAVQTDPSYSVNLSSMAKETGQALADQIYRDAPDAPGVGGCAEEAAAFAGRWSECADNGARALYAHRVYECTAPTSAAATAEVPGTLRKATVDDRNRLIEMMEGFYREIGESGDPSGTVDRRLQRGLYRVLEVDGHLASAICHSCPVSGVSRVQFLWTDPQFRRSGYAAKTLSLLSNEFFEAGIRPMLFTDLADAATNRLYRRLGYRAVAEQLGYGFGTSTSPS